MRRSVWTIFALVALAQPARAADDRSLLNHCRALVAQAMQAQRSAASDEAELKSCQQIIREWTLRDSRMSVDEDGRPLR